MVGERVRVGILLLHLVSGYSFIRVLEWIRHQVFGMDRDKGIHIGFFFPLLAPASLYESGISS